MPGGVAPATLSRGIGRRAAPLAIIADLHLDNGETGIQAVDVIRGEINAKEIGRAHV